MLTEELKKWTYIDFSTGKLILKDDAPDDIKKKAYISEKEYFKTTQRRRISNIDLI